MELLVYLHTVQLYTFSTYVADGAFLGFLWHIPGMFLGGPDVVLDVPAPAHVHMHPDNGADHYLHWRCAETFPVISD